MTTTQPHEDFVGRGLSFPARIDARGRIALASGYGDIEESIRIILMTAPGERVMRPRFGCGIWDFMFAPLHQGTLTGMAFAVRAALAEWEPRIVVEDVTATRLIDAPGQRSTSDGDGQTAVSIDIVYRVRATNDRRNLVHPFYVIPKEGKP